MYITRDCLTELIEDVRENLKYGAEPSMEDLFESAEHVLGNHDIDVIEEEPETFYFEDAQSYVQRDGTVIEVGKYYQFLSERVEVTSLNVCEGHGGEAVIEDPWMKVTTVDVEELMPWHR